MNEIVISANRFLDLLQCVVPTISSDATRQDICVMQLQILAKDYSMRAASTNGRVLSVAQRQLGFSDEQEDWEDLDAKAKVKDAIWLIRKTDVEILILSLRKLGVKREDNKKGIYYICIKEIENEGKKRLTISILGLSHLDLEPTLQEVEFPNWRSLTPKNIAEIAYIGLNLISLNIVSKCWGNIGIFMNFYEGSMIKITRNSGSAVQENDSDFILLASDYIAAEEPEDENQLNFLD